MRLLGSYIGFVGRDSELARLTALLDDGAILVTLVGPAGIGKTALARRLVQTQQAKLCELAEARNVQEIVAALASAVGVPPPQADDDHAALASVGQALAGGGPIVVVLDACEHLVALLPACLDRWLELAPEAQLVCTSRQPLGVSFERLIDVGPLSVPADDSARGEAASLWEARNGPVPADEAAVLSAILRALEGNPLAIELAAARARLLGLRETLRRLDREEEVLARGQDSASWRHASVHRAIAASWDLLDDAERSALSRLAVMRGSFSFAAAEAVMGALDRSPLSLLEALCDKSLLRPVDVGAERRLTHWLGVRRFAEEQSNEREQAELAHARFFAAMARADTSHGVALEGPSSSSSRTSSGAAWASADAIVAPAPPSSAPVSPFKNACARPSARSPKSSPSSAVICKTK